MTTGQDALYTNSTLALNPQTGQVEWYFQHVPGETLDLDIVSYGTEELECRGLKLPHPRAHDRLFVLLPLEELAPHFRFVGDDRILATHIKNAAAIRMEKLANSTK